MPSESSSLSESFSDTVISIGAGIATTLISYQIFQALIKKYRFESHPAKSLRKWHTILKLYYPLCNTQITQIYEALSLLPLIVHALQNTEESQVLTEINNIVQDILARNYTSAELQNDETYLQAVKLRLEAAYKKIHPDKNSVLICINETQLRGALSTELELNNFMPDKTINSNTIAACRSSINRCIALATQSPNKLIQCLSGLAKDLEEIHHLFAGKIFRHFEHLGYIEYTTTKNLKK